VGETAGISVNYGLGLLQAVITPHIPSFCGCFVNSGKMSVTKFIWGISSFVFDRSLVSGSKYFVVQTPENYWRIK
jgi:hypothetical protein